MRSPLHFLPLFRRSRRWRILRNREGITAIEFALIAPVLLTMILGIIELSLIFFIQNVMETAAANTARQGKTGYTAQNLSQQETITNTLLQYTGGLLDPFSIRFTYISYSNFSDIGNPNKGTPGLGSPGQIVVYTISYPWKIITPVMTNILGTDGIFTITSRIVVKNEPYE